MKSISKTPIKNQKSLKTRKQNRLKAIALATMCLTLFMTNFDETVMNMALPQIQVSLNASMSSLQWILNAYILPIAALVLPSGTLGDIYGRKRVFLGGVILFMVASAICGLSLNLPMLIGGRLLQGVGAAAVIPGSLAILADTFPDPQEKGKAIAIWSAVAGLALIVGPLLGGLLVDAWGWQSVFFLNIPLGIITFSLTCRYIKKTVVHPKKESLDWLGMLLSIVLLVAVVFALTEEDGSRFFLATIALFSLLAFLAIESRHSHPMLPLSLFKNSTIASVSIVKVLVFFTLVSSLFIFSLFLQQIKGYSAAEAGMCFLPMNIAFIFASLISGWLGARLGWRLTIAVGLVIAAVAMFSFVRLSVNTQYEAFWRNLLLAGFGTGLTISPLTAMAMSAAPPTKAGITSAILNTTTRLGGMLGIAIQGTILSQRIGSKLERSLAAWDLAPDLQERLIADALHYGTNNVANSLPSHIALVTWQQAFNRAFVSGLQATALLSSAVLLAGALLVVVFSKPSSRKTVEN